MAKEIYGFGKKETGRIADVVRRVEAQAPSRPGGGGRKWGREQLVGKITGDGDSAAPAGSYEVVQMVWDGAAWEVVAGGLTWDGGEGNLPEVYEINATEGIAADTIIFPYLVGASDGSFQWVFAAGGADANKVMVSANDTTPNYLLNKLVAGTYIDLTENNDGGNETITIDVDLTELPSHVLGNDQVIVHAAGAAPKWADLATFACP